MNTSYNRAANEEFICYSFVRCCNENGDQRSAVDFFSNWDNRGTV